MKRRNSRQAVSTCAFTVTSCSKGSSAGASPRSWRAHYEINPTTLSFVFHSVFLGFALFLCFFSFSDGDSINLPMLRQVAYSRACAFFARPMFQLTQSATMLSLRIPHEFQRLGVVVLTAGHETEASMARASGQPSWASLPEPYAPAYASLRTQSFLLFMRAATPVKTCETRETGSQGITLFNWFTCLNTDLRQETPSLKLGPSDMIDFSTPAHHRQIRLLKSADSETLLCPSEDFNSACCEMQELPINVHLVLFSNGMHMRSWTSSCSKRVRGLLAWGLVVTQLLLGM